MKTPKADSTTTVTIPTLMMIATTMLRMTWDCLKIAELEFSTKELIFVTNAKLCKFFGGLKKNVTNDYDDREQRTEKSSMKLIGRTVFLITK
jgi:hypothetical protein